MADKIKVPFGTIENGKLSEMFSSDPKKAAKQYLESQDKTEVATESIEKYFPHKDYQNWLNKFSIELAKLKLKNLESPDEDLILLARTYEELTHFSKVLKNRKEVLKNYDSYSILEKNSERLADKLERKIRKQAEKVAPNTTSLLGPVLTARLIAKAGGLEKLAKMPVSKIQILGAEKSLFRYLREKEEGRDTKTPKYGIIFLSPYILNAKKNRGKIARLLATKVALSARFDFFSKTNKSEQLKNEFLESYEKLTEK